MTTSGFDRAFDEYRRAIADVADATATAGPSSSSSARASAVPRAARASARCRGRRDPLDPRDELLAERIARSFKRFDAGDKGWLDAHDLKCAFASLVGCKPSKEELRAMTSSCPRGEVDLFRFSPYMLDRLSSSRAATTGERDEGEDEDEDAKARREDARRTIRARAVFDAFDARRVGHVTLEDAVAAFATAAPATPCGVVADVFREADVDDDGKVTFEEFKGVFLGGGGGAVFVGC
jgi:Ca2+-binding EF-hand superfamily protein